MEELDLKEIFAMCWRKKLEIILIVFLLLCVGVIYSYVYVQPEYSASTTLVLAMSQDNTDKAITQTDVILNSNLVSTYSELIKSKSIAREVIKNLNNKDLTESFVRKSVTVKAVADTELIKITVVNEDPDLASDIANEIANVFSNKIVEIYNISNVFIVDKAEPSNVPSNINHFKDLVLFAFVGGIISIAYIVIDHMVDNTIKTEDDIEKIVGLTVLVSIPNYEIENKRGGRKK